MSGNTVDRIGEPTLADHVTRIRNLNYQIHNGRFPDDLVAQLQTDLAQHRETFPEAAAAYDAEQAAVRVRIQALAQRAGEVTLSQA